MRRIKRVCEVKDNVPAFPTKTKNHTLPVTFTSHGTAYAGRRSISTIAQNAFNTSRVTALLFGSCDVRVSTHPASHAYTTPKGRTDVFVRGNECEGKGGKGKE